MKYYITPFFFKHKFSIYFTLALLVILPCILIINTRVQNGRTPLSIPLEKNEINKIVSYHQENKLLDKTSATTGFFSNYPATYSCDNTTLLVGDLLPNGDGQTISFPFGNGTSAPPACTQKLNYGGEGLAYCGTTNQVYIARFAPNQIGVWDLTTNSLASSISLTTGSPYDVAMTTDCAYLYVATSQGIERINLSTNTIDQTRSAADLNAATAVNGQPWGIDIHPITGEIFTTLGWFSHTPAYGGGPKEGAILKVASDLQGPITEVVPQETDGLFMGMKFLPNGNFWVTWDGEEPSSFPFPYVHSEEIRLYDATGILLESKPIIIGGNQEFFTEPNDISFGPDGNIYVTTYAEYCVIRYLPATDTWEEYLGLDPSGATGKNLEFVCANVFCVEICENGIDDDGDGFIDEYCVDDCAYVFDKNNTFENGEGNWSFANTEVILGDSYQYDSLGSATFHGIPIGGGLFSWGQTGAQTVKIFHDPTKNSGHPEGDYFVGVYDGAVCFIDSTASFGKCGFEVCLQTATTVNTWIDIESAPNLTNSNERKLVGREYRTGTTLWNWEETCVYISPDSIPPVSEAIIVSIRPTGGSPYPPVYIDSVKITPILGPSCYVEVCELCNDGIDNDGDGLIDCADTNCPSCITLNCEDGIQLMTTVNQSASGAGLPGIPSLTDFFIPEGNNRAIFMVAYFEREHCQSGDDCTVANTSGTGIGDNYASPTALTDPQITGRFTGAGGSIDKINPLFLPDGDLRFGNQFIGTTINNTTAIYSREAYYIAIYESEIDSLLSGASSGNITITLPDILTPMDEADDAILVAYAFSNVWQTSEGIVRSGSDISKSPDASYSGDYTLSDTDLDYLQEPNEPEDGLLILGMNGVQNYGFENISGFSTITNTSVANNLGDYQEYQEADGISLTGLFRNGPSSGIIDSISLQSSAPSSLTINGGLMAVFTIESCSGIEICGDGIDNDSDGDKDFDDADCDICNTTFSTEKFYISKYGSSPCGDDLLILDWEAETTTASDEQNLGQEVGGSGWSDIAFTPDGQLFGNYTSNTDNMELYNIDPSSGRFISYICQIDGTNPYLTQWELVADIDGYLYTILGDGITTALYKYKPTDTNTDGICDSLTLVLDLTATGLVGDGDLAWSNGLLYWSATTSNNVSSPAQLVEIDIQAGTNTIHPLVDNLGNNLLNVDAVVNDSEGNLIIGDENSILYEVDKSNFSVSIAYNLSNTCGAIGGLSTRYEFIQSAPCPEICNDGIDNDGDGLTDCEDPDCPCCKAQAPTLSKQ